MHVPSPFQNTNTSVLFEFIRQNGFGILISQGTSGLVATHIPFSLSDDGTKLSAHIARANPQWKNIANDQEVLIIFNGPHTYISSSWYSHKNVPTWNYVVAHVYGKVKITDDETLRHDLKKLNDHYESNLKEPFVLESLPTDIFERQFSAIVGLEITISRIESSFKLSQNRNDVDHSSIIHELKKRGDENSSGIAGLMEKNRCPITHH